VTLRSIGVLAFLLARSASAANWTDYRSGPLHVISNAGDKAARDRLTEMEQLRYTLGTLLGKTDMQLIWPVDLVLFPTQRDLGPHALPQAFAEGGSAALATWTADTALPRDFLRQLTQRFLDANSGRMPEAIELGLQDLFSTLQVNATKVSLGAPLKDGELPPERLRAWAKLQMLATQPSYSGKLRVYLNNLQQNADEDVASRNAFAISAAELNQRADAYLKTGSFSAAPVNGETVAPARDFVEKPFPQTSVDSLFAELKSNGKEYPPESPRGLLDKGTKESIQAAIKANPRWAEPHVALAEQNFEWKDRIPELKVAANLEPRNAALWQGLSKAQAKAEQYADADKSEAQAEKAAANETERETIHKAHANLEEERAAFAIEERRRKAADEAALLQKAKDNAAAEVRAAEDASHKRTGTLAAGEVPVPWWQDEVGEKLSGTLTRVDCQNAGPLKLTIQPASGKPVLLFVRDPHNLAVKGGKEANFACGVQKPVRKINLVFDGKPDAKQGTSGDVRVVEFP
jgi:hypothetical protein